MTNLDRLTIGAIDVIVKHTLTPQEQMHAQVSRFMMRIATSSEVNKCLAALAGQMIPTVADMDEQQLRMYQVSLLTVFGLAAQIGIKLAESEE